MATTVTMGFKKLRDNLEITDLQASTVSTRQSNVRDAVRAELTVLDDFLTGSYMRSTMIAPLKSADVDIFVVLDPSYYSADGQAALLDRLKRVLRKTYPQTPAISRAGQAVTITFTDFKVDVVPAFYRQGGGYLIPDTVGKRWIGTDPRAHVKLWSDRNKAQSGQLVPVLKMLKCWNREHGGYLRSFYLETLALQTFNGITITNDWSGIRYFFDHARSTVGAYLNDPAGYSSIRPPSENDVKEIKSRLETALQRARSAEAADKAGEPEEAFRLWRLIFGNYYPAYG